MPAGRKPLSKDSFLRDPRYRSIIRYYVSGISLANISRKTGTPQSTLWRLVHHAAFQEALIEFDKERFRQTDKLIQYAHLKAAEALIKSVGRLRRLVRHKDPNVAFTAFEKLVKLLARHGEKLTTDEGDGTGLVPRPVNLLQIFGDNPQALRAAQSYLDSVRPNGERVINVTPTRVERGE